MESLGELSSHCFSTIRFVMDYQSHSLDFKETVYPELKDGTREGEGKDITQPLEMEE